MPEERTRLHVAERYDVVVGNTLLDELPALVGADAQRVAVLCDGELANLSNGVCTTLDQAGYEVA